jgi:hypothetical protein
MDGWTVPVPVPSLLSFQDEETNSSGPPYPSNALRQSAHATLVAFLKIVGLPCLCWQPFFDKAFF